MLNNWMHIISIICLTMLLNIFFSSHAEAKEFLVEVDESLPVVGNILEEIVPHKVYLIETDQTQEQLELNPDIRAVYEDETVFLPDLPGIFNLSSLASEDWGYSFLQLDEILYGNEKVKVAMLDTGVDLHHPKLAPYIKGAIDVTNYDNPQDSVNHGTKVAGIIAYNMPDTIELLSIKIFTASNQSSVSRVVKGIEAAIESDADVINMSFGTFQNAPLIEDAIKRALAQNIVIVAAGGNFGGTGLTYPARYDGVVAVGSIGPNGERSSFSQKGVGLDFMAPGEQVLTTSIGGGMVQDSGTSLSAAYITKMVAAYLSHSQLDMPVYEVMQQSAQYSEPSLEVGFGVIQMEQFAYRLILPYINAPKEPVREIELVQKNWNITFSEEPSPETVNIAKVFIIGTDHKIVPLHRQVKGAQLLVTPERPYDHHVQYQLVIHPDFTSKNNRSLNKTTILPFYLH